jgi:predicted TIM-barrel fold metal-dependent hydrolase
MSHVVNVHQHISNATQDRRYLPWRQSWHVCMDWAYASGWGRGHTDRLPPYPRDPERLFRNQHVRFADPKGEWTIRDMDEAGVDTGILLPLDYDFSWGSPSDIPIEEKHEHLSRLQKDYPGRFCGLAGPDPRRPGADEILNRAIKDLGLRGLKVIPKAGYYAWDERAYRLYERCLTAGLPIAICTEPDGGGYNRDRFAQPIHVSDVVADYPDLRIVLLHAGAPLYHWLEEALCVATGGINVSLQLDFWIAGFYPVPNLLSDFLSDEESVVILLSRVRDIIGAQRMMWGSDTFSGPGNHGDRVFGSAYPFGVREVVAWLRDLPGIAAKYGKTFTTEETALILGDNAMRTFGLSDSGEWKRPHEFALGRPSPIPFKGGYGG